MVKHLKDLLGVATLMLVMLVVVTGRALYFTQHASDFRVMSANAANPAQVIAHTGGSREK